MYKCQICILAEKEGFEPSMRFLPCRFSKAVHSTSLPLFRTCNTNGEYFYCTDFDFFKIIGIIDPLDFLRNKSMALSSNG